MRKDQRLIKPSFPDTIIGNLLKEANQLKYEKIYNYEYSYFTKTNDGLKKDISSNDKYGNDREGYEQWSQDNPDKSMSYSGVTSIREMSNRKTGEILGYMFEKKLNDNIWLKNIKVLFEKAWKEFCQELNINDSKAMDYFLFNDISYDFRDSGQEIINKFRILLDVIEKYNDPEELDFKKMIDKIKS